MWDMPATAGVGTQTRRLINRSSCRAARRAAGREPLGGLDHMTHTNQEPPEETAPRPRAGG